MAAPALVPCRACGQLVSRSALRCFFCGAALAPEPAAPDETGIGKPVPTKSRKAPDPADALLRRPKRKVASTEAYAGTIESRVREYLKSDPHWKVLAGPDWICPYCARVGARNLAAGGDPAGTALRHLRACREWKHFDGILREIPELQSSAEAARAERTLKIGIAGDERFRMRTPDGWWMCPFCGTLPGVPAEKDGKPRGEASGRALSHLKTCPGYRSRLAEPLPAERLRDRIDPSRTLAGGPESGIAAAIETNLSKNPLWRMRDGEGAWVCPFCASCVGLSANAPDAAAPAVRSSIEAHLEACAGFAKGAGQPLSMERLRRAAEASTERAAEADALAIRVSTDPVWSLSDRAGFWICPHCRESVPQIPISERTELSRRIQLHLNQHCAARRAGRPAAATIEDALRGRMRPESARAAPASLIRELEQARALQLSLLPDLPKIPGIEFAASYHPSEHLGGDFYDFLDLKSRGLGIVIGDISGHGLEAALLMGMVKKMLQVAAAEAESPSEVLRRTDEGLRGDLPRDIFVTVLYGILEIPERRFTFARAGHPYPALLRMHPTPTASLLKGGGLALGLGSKELVGSTLSDRTVEMAAGDILLLLTDGIFETSRAGEMFGVPRVLSILARESKGPLPTALERIEAESTSFLEPGDPGDDMTMVAVRFLP
ncbi:MAG: PP2C family protein-serine/threonine phosphatase [Planctomycetota bacterium]